MSRLATCVVCDAECEIKRGTLRAGAAIVPNGERHGRPTYAYVCSKVCADIVETRNKGGGGN
jgi:hypothetical protein